MLYGSTSNQKTDFTRMVEELKDSSTVERFSFVSRGYIKEIKDSILVLEHGESTLEIPIRVNAQIVEQIEGEAVPKIVSFQDVQVGDGVSCLVEIEKDGSWSAYRVKIITKKSSQ